MSRRVVLYIAMSLDGFIAGPNDDMSFLSLVEQPGEDYGYARFVETVDTVILGRRTYDWVMTQVDEFPHANKVSYVITKTAKENIGTTHFYSGDLKELVAKLKNDEGKNIFVDGGSQIVHELLKDNLIDEIIISVIPVLLGNGIRLFQTGSIYQKLEHVSTEQYKSGLTQLHYMCKRV